MDTAQSPKLKSVADVIMFPDMLHQPSSIGYVEKMIIGQLVMMSQPRLIVETRIFNGQTTRFVADFIAMNHLPACRVVSFDFPDVVQKLRQAEPYFAGHPEIEMIAGRLPETLAQFLATCVQPVDLAIIDADHSYSGVKEELWCVHPKLRPGGYVFCHDYREHDPEYAGLRVAIEEFAQRHHYHFLPLQPSQHRGQEIIWGAAILRKPINSRERWRRRLNPLRRVLRIIKAPLRKAKAKMTVVST
jgi:predicted O-methyltransferase YrrM